MNTIISVTKKETGVSFLFYIVVSGGSTVTGGTGATTSAALDASTAGTTLADFKKLFRRISFCVFS